tara:strand:+ start:104 stop:334 length:231 start_codon:yes stop_codon:yes gene_type:complete
VTFSEIKIKDDSKIKITKDTVNGITFGQIRLWKLDINTNSFLPTNKGIGFELKHINEIIYSLSLLYHSESNIIGKT